MKDWFDQEKIECIICGHRWILISNKKITDKQHYNWVKKSLIQHEKIKKEKGI